MLRLVFISLIAALVLLTPALAQQLDRTLPGTGLLQIPATGLAYMGIFFHELGHTLAYWLFGMPALPTFDWQDGGGMTYAHDRSMALQGGVWLLMAAGLYWLWKTGEWTALIVAGCVALSLFALSFSDDGRDVLCLYMGHGGEILVACFCILRALTNTVEGNMAVEKWLNMIFGLFTLGRNALLCIALYDEVGQAVYDMQKGGHMQGDFRRVAEICMTGIENVATFSLIFMGVMLALTFAAAWRMNSR